MAEMLWLSLFPFPINQFMMLSDRACRRQEHSNFFCYCRGISFSIQGQVLVHQTLSCKQSYLKANKFLSNLLFFVSMCLIC